MYVAIYTLIYTDNNSTPSSLFISTTCWNVILKQHLLYLKVQTRGWSWLRHLSSTGSAPLGVFLLGICAQGLGSPGRWRHKRATCQIPASYRIGTRLPMYSWWNWCIDLKRKNRLNPHNVMLHWNEYNKYRKQLQTPLCVLLNLPLIDWLYVFYAISGVFQTHEYVQLNIKTWHEPIYRRSIVYIWRLYLCVLSVIIRA